MHTASEEPELASRSVGLRDRNVAQLERSCRTRFVREASAGTLADHHYARYLAIEESFVRQAVRFNAYLAFADPSWTGVSEHLSSIDHLLTDQLSYFARVRERHPDTRVAIDRAVLASGVLAEQVQLAISERGFAGAAVSMFAAETLYSQWCTAAAEFRTLDQHNDLDAWIGLHAESDFAAQVAKFARLVDAIPSEQLDDHELDQLFGDMLSAEDHFHNSIYAEE